MGLLTRCLSKEPNFYYVLNLLNNMLVAIGFSKYALEENSETGQISIGHSASSFRYVVILRLLICVLSSISIYFFEFRFSGLPEVVQQLIYLIFTCGGMTVPIFIYKYQRKYLTVLKSIIIHDQIICESSTHFTSKPSYKSVLIGIYLSAFMSVVFMIISIWTDSQFVTIDGLLRTISYYVYYVFITIFICSFLAFLHYIRLSFAIVNESLIQATQNKLSVQVLMKLSKIHDKTAALLNEVYELYAVQVVILFIVSVPLLILTSYPLTIMVFDKMETHILFLLWYLSSAMYPLMTTYFCHVTAEEVS